ncbi:MAG: Maf family protein, partial [Oscillospiraceae bacterium]|nr:Maf family protein [Oscillospiraceae bacterium]
HDVYTGVAVAFDGKMLRACRRTAVYFRELTDAEIAAYVATGEPMDKAGAYGAQGLGALFIDRIDGDFFNVMGLPLCLTGRLLAEAGIKVLREMP